MQQQHIHFARASDGVSIAYSSIGAGPPLLLSNGWVSHLELDLEEPRAVRFMEGLSSGGRRRLIRFDCRGSGLSEREVDDVSVEARARDFEAVVEHMGLEKVAILAWSMNGPPAMVYAATHPEKVSHLILYATFASQRHSGREPLGRALVDLIRAEWRIGSRAIVEFEHPNADKDVADALNRYHLAAASGEVAAQILEEALFEVDVRKYLPNLTMPTLVLHRRDDRAFPSSCGRELASLLPHGHFVPLPGELHLPFHGDSQGIIDAVNEFLTAEDGHGAPGEQGMRQFGMAQRMYGLQIILFTDIEGSTTLTQHLGDAAAQDVVRTHNRVVREALEQHGGSEIKHTGDGIMASLGSASRAITCAVDIQQGLAAHNDSNPETPIRVRVGLNAGEPVAEDGDLFGSAVQLASRIAAEAEPGQILVSDVVRQLAAGKGVLFSDQGDVTLRGFEDPVRLFEVRWRE